MRKKLRDKFDRIKTAVRETLAETPRANSIVENLNPPQADLPSYFFLRRQIGSDYLHLLRFFFNHRAQQSYSFSHYCYPKPSPFLNQAKKSQIFPAEIGRRLPTSQPVNAYVSCRLYITGAVRGKFAGSGSCRQ